MIVLHAIWDGLTEGKLHIWAESSTLPIAISASTKRSADVEQARPHPFALTAPDALQEIIGGLADNLVASNAKKAMLALRLPSTSKEPLSSPELLWDIEHTMGRGKRELRWWNVTTITLDASHAFDFLLALSNMAPTGVALGSSLRFWSTVASFAYELLIKQAYMPTLSEEQRGRTITCRAAWEVILSDDDYERMQSLVTMMPPVCWSFFPSGEKKRALLRDCVMSFLNQVVDAFVRENLATTTLLPTKGRRKSAKSLSLPEQWLQALSNGNATITAPGEELKSFVATTQTWLKQLRPSLSDAPFRTCFRLDPPEPSATTAVESSSQKGQQEEMWHVSFHLQANDDRSLLVPAEQVWQERSSTLTFLKRKFENPQERLLADLARAARLFPPIEESLKTARPQVLPLTTEEAYTFLRQSAPLLEQSGFGVLVPPWWQKSSARLRVKMRLKPKGGESNAGLLGFDGLVAYDWNVAIGDTTLSEQEFAHLVNLKMPLIQVRGQWVELRPEEIEAAIQFFKKKRDRGNMSLGEALRLGLGQEQNTLGLQVAELEAEGWIKDLLEKLGNSAKIDTIEVPETLHGTLRPYQLKGVSWLTFLRQYGLGACLADDMGLGKCIGAESLVTVNGSLLKAEDIWTLYAGEQVFDGEGYWTHPKQPLLTSAIDTTTGRITQASFKRLYRQHVSERLRKIRLEDGSSITITQLHKLLTDKGWTNDLHVGDYVCVPAKLLWSGISEDKDLIKVMAWQIAEGYEVATKNTLTITQKDVVVLEDIKHCFECLSIKYDVNISKVTIFQPAKKVPYLRITSKNYRKFLEAKGYQWGHLSANKRIPDFIMQADLDSVRIFLRSFFQAEASVVNSMRSIEISSASALLMQQLSFLLRRFGIWIRISVKQKRATNGSGIFRPYQIGVLGGNAMRKFCKEIGFPGKEKQARLEKICELVSNTNVEGIPASEIMAQIIAATKLPIRHFGMPTVYAYGSQQFSLTSLRTVISAVDGILSGKAEREYQEIPPSKWTTQTLNAYATLDKQFLTATRTKLQRLVEQEVYYCKIKEIEEIFYDGWVYDFEVENYHNFVANNILCHNTVQLTTLLLHNRIGHQDVIQPNPALVICPMSIVGNWQRELQRFAPSLRVMVHHGHERLSGQAFEDEARQHDVVITTYALALRDKEHLQRVTWDTVVIDEAQNIKNEVAKQTQAIKQIESHYKIALTGTPVENRLSELWSIMDFLNPGYLGSGEAFRKNFALPIERYHKAEQAEMLKRLIQPFVLRRVKTDKEIIKDLPDKMEMKVFCNLTQEQASLYEAVVKEMMKKIEEADGIERKGLILSTLTKLKQVCNHPAQFMSDGSSLAHRSGKLARLEEMLEEVLAEGDKALIFTQYAEMGTLLRSYLQERLGCETLFLHGGVQKQQRDMMVQRFQEEQRGPALFILSLKAGGVGLNLTAANHVFHFDRWWNPAVENQATDRAFRIGQKRNVQVHKFVCAGTLEERIDMMIEQKKELAERIVGSGENWLTEMSTDQLKDLFALSRDAVAE